MNPENTAAVSTRYTPVAIALHWRTGGLLTGLARVGVSMQDRPPSPVRLAR